MDRSPALLLLLTLGLCEYRHGVVRSPKDITQLRVGQRLELECQTDKNSGAFWIHQDKSGTLHFIVFISSVSQTTLSRDQRTSPRFEASKHNSIYLLVVKSFTPQDEGNYFCMMNFNQMLFFSPGQPAFLPAVSPTNPISLLACPRHPVTNPLVLLPEAPCLPPLFLGLLLPKGKDDWADPALPPHPHFPMPPMALKGEG
uniref:Uncharacterized protein n=1 Tax=Corvus moneduloides TaxID=1196302 RepID=A0A8C3E0H3_CORMO